jgi:CRP-like cAMP-binding protein
MAYIHGMKKPRSASVVSNSPVTVIKIRTEALHQASIQLQTKFNKVLMRTLAERLEKTSMMASAL